jgi:hypothetical protein
MEVRTALEPGFMHRNSHRTEFVASDANPKSFSLALTAGFGADANNQGVKRPSAFRSFS